MTKIIDLIHSYNYDCKIVNDIHILYKYNKISNKFRTKGILYSSFNTYYYCNNNIMYRIYTDWYIYIHGNWYINNYNQLIHKDRECKEIFLNKNNHIKIDNNHKTFSNYNLRIVICYSTNFIIYKDCFFYKNNLFQINNITSYKTFYYKQFDNNYIFISCCGSKLNINNKYNINYRIAIN